MPGAWAISAIDFSRRRANSTARRRNSGGLAAGIQDSSPEAILASDQVSGNRVGLRTCSGAIKGLSSGWRWVSGALGTAPSHMQTRTAGAAMVRVGCHVVVLWRSAT